jgi:hypothetical protein
MTSVDLSSVALSSAGNGGMQKAELSAGTTASEKSTTTGTRENAARGDKTQRRVQLHDRHHTRTARLVRHLHHR